MSDVGYAQALKDEANVQALRATDGLVKQSLGFGLNIGDIQDPEKLREQLQVQAQARIEAEAELQALKLQAELMEKSGANYYMAQAEKYGNKAANYYDDYLSIQKAIANKESFWQRLIKRLTRLKRDMWMLLSKPS